MSVAGTVGASEAASVSRWKLNRAGIINVYQYGDEVLPFEGGRLLLRGINGSGKSTAMNMLLPFLLDADMRRIDASGEQSGVLRSWMLSGRDEPQPQGYLWLEVSRGNEHLCFGCGIRASRATDQVSTWWFVTKRRPRFDLNLVEDRVPLSRDALREAIAPDPVYSQDQRAEYRAELCRKIFDGADIEPHLHLLRIVRNPRVGDRLDTELPQHLLNALPQLSETSLDDASQPLEDLNEHRRNVEELRKTAEALDALHEVYRGYARAELHKVADSIHATLSYARDCRRAEEASEKAWKMALDAKAQGEQDARDLREQCDRRQNKIEAIRASDDYKSGAQLNDVRMHVDTLRGNLGKAGSLFTALQRARSDAAQAVSNARHEVAAERDSLARRLSDLSRIASATRLSNRPPPMSNLELPVDLPGSPAPGSALATAAAEQGLVALGIAGRSRLEDIALMESEVRAVAMSEARRREAERAEHEAQRAKEQTREAQAAAREGFQSALATWRAAAAEWTERLQQHHAVHLLGEVALPASLTSPAEEIVRGTRLSRVMEELALPAVRRHEGDRARQESARDVLDRDIESLEARALELAGRHLPDPPLLSWQRRHYPCLAELVEFQPGLDDAKRAGLEASLEASGLLAAEVARDGSLRLVDGQLVIITDAAVPQPLSELLQPALSSGDESVAAQRDVVDRVLRGISLDIESPAGLAVTPCGEFRLGALRGRHQKQTAEHIGLAARRAALERQRADVAQLLDDARARRATLMGSLAITALAQAEALSLREGRPSDDDLHGSHWQVGAATRAVDVAETQLMQRQRDLELADQQHSDATSSARQTSLRLGLPATEEELRDFWRDVTQLIAESREAQANLGRLARDFSRWARHGETWRTACAAEQQGEVEAASLHRQLTSAQERLSMLESTVGAAYTATVAALQSETIELEVAKLRLQEIDRTVIDCATAVTRSEMQRQQAEHERLRAEADCQRVVELLPRMGAVPGLVDAAVEDVAPDTSPSATPGGESSPVRSALDTLAAVLVGTYDVVTVAKEIVEKLRAGVPVPATVTSAEGVRQSLRRRRDALGAGWDAEDRQPYQALPLHIEVTGPLAQQMALPAARRSLLSQLGTMTSLLSSKQDQALRNLLQGLVAREVAARLHAASELIERMNRRLALIKTSHGIGVKLRWRQREDIDPLLARTVELLSKTPDLRTLEEDAWLADALGRRIEEAHREDPGLPYRDLIAHVLDYRDWHDMTVLLLRVGRAPERLSKRSTLSEGEKKIVSYLPLFSAVAASCDGLADSAPGALRFVLLDDAFAKVSEDNHAKLFGLLVELDLDFIATSERLWGTHPTVPSLAITEVVRDAELATIVLEHYRWDGGQLRVSR